MITPETYQPFNNLPPLAGVATFVQASAPGLGIESCTDRLKRFHFAFKRLFEILTSRIAAEPVYELKCGFSYHAYLCAEHVDALRNRIGEMREPPLGLEAIPHTALDAFFDEIQAAPSTGELVVGLYECAFPALQESIARYRAQTNPLADAPSVRVCRFASIEIGDMLAYGQNCVASLVRDDSRTAMGPWRDRLSDLLRAAGSLDGSEPQSEVVPERMHSKTPYQYDPVPKRDDRWQDLWNQGVNAEAFLYDETKPAKAKALMMLFKRLREVDVPEMMSSILTQTKGKPWKYYRDMTRQMWDEARHAMMGEVGFVSLGVDWTKARITHNWSTRLNTECTPMERHAVLYFIEQGLMTKTGKRYEWEVGVESGIPLMATIQDFDWADEVLHAAIGRQWYIPEFGNINKALEYGDQCWSKILSNWDDVKARGLTNHDNWWPAIYSQACETWQQTPEPDVLAYATTYAGKRADLKAVQAGAGG